MEKREMEGSTKGEERKKEMETRRERERGRSEGRGWRGQSPVVGGRGLMRDESGGAAQALGNHLRPRNRCGGISLQPKSKSKLLKRINIRDNKEPFPFFRKQKQ